MLTKLSRYYFYQFYMVLRTFLIAAISELNLFFSFENNLKTKSLVSSTFQELVALYYPLTFTPNAPFNHNAENGIIICNHVHPTLDIISLQYLGHLLNIPMTFVGYIDFKGKLTTQPLKICMGIQNLPYAMGTNKKCCWDTSLSTWIARRASYISLDWDKTTNRPVQGSYEKLKTEGINVLANGGYVVGFPEGCYDGTYVTKKFYPGLFKLAIETSKPIYVITLVYRDKTTKTLLTGNDITHSKQTECYISINAVLNSLQFKTNVDRMIKIAFDITNIHINNLSNVD